MTKRQEILSATKTIIDAIVDETSATVIKYSESEKIGIVDLGLIPYPAAFIYIGSQNREIDSGGEAVLGASMETWRSTLNIEVISDAGSEIETVLGHVQKALNINYTLNNTVCYSRILGITHYIIDVEHELQSFVLDVEIIHRNRRDTP